VANGKQGTLIQRIYVRTELPGTRFELTLNAFENPSILEIVNPHPLQIEVKLIFRRNGGNTEEISFSLHPPVIEVLGMLPINIYGVREPGPPLIITQIVRL